MWKYLSRFQTAEVVIKGREAIKKTIQFEEVTRKVKKVKKIHLKPVDWKVGSIPDFLHLNPNEVAFIEMKLALARSIRFRRRLLKLTQSELAQLIDSSQSRVAKMESADFSVTLDLLIRVLLVLGASRKEVANVIALESKHAA